MSHSKTPDIDVNKFADKSEIKAAIEDVKSFADHSAKALAAAKVEGTAKIKEGAQYIKETAKDDLQLAKSYVRENPKKTAAMAILGGFLLKRLLTSKK